MSPKRLRRQQFRFFIFFSSLALVVFTAATLGCGSGGMTSLSTAPALSGNTMVMVQLSSTGNDQLSQYNIGLSSFALTSQSGKSVSLFSTITSPTPPLGEFMHLNGPVEPLLTATVPQDVYTTATATLSGAGGFACVSQIPGAVQTSFFGPPQSVTITLPSPITVTGRAMALSLDLQVSQSATFSSCNLQGATYTNTPTFTLVPVVLSSQPTNVENGKQNGIEGLVASVTSSGSGFTMVTPDGIRLSVTTGGSTVYQGVSGQSALVAGMPIEMDTAIQGDGSLLATRVEVEDTNTNTVSVMTGPLLIVADSQPTFTMLARQQQGYLFAGVVSGPADFSFSNATFKISGQFANLQNLPFPATFTGATMFDGQNVYVSSHATTISGGPTYVPLSTITLMPQTINGTVSAVGSDGAFTTYTVTLASYDLIPNLAVQPGQTTVLTDPSNVVVYVDSNTQTLNSTPLAAGSLLRFNGLLFNDNGTLRMDCGQVNDGVAE